MNLTELQVHTDRVLALLQQPLVHGHFVVHYAEGRLQGIDLLQTFRPLRRPTPGRHLDKPPT